MAIDSIRDRLKKRLAEQAKGSEEDKPDAKRKMADLKARLATLKTKRGSEETVDTEVVKVKLPANPNPKPKPKLKAKTQKPVVSDYSDPGVGAEPSDDEQQNELDDQVPVDLAEDNTDTANDQYQQDDEELSQEDRDEIERRINLIRSNSDLNRLRAVTNTKYKQVFEVAIEELTERDVSAWEAVLANAPSPLVSKAIEKCENFQNKVNENLVFHAFPNPELDNALRGKLISLAEKRGKFSALQANLPTRMDLDTSRSLAEIFSTYIIKGEYYSAYVTNANLPFHIFLLHFVHKKLSDSNTMLIISDKIIGEFDMWSATNKREGLLLLPVFMGTVKGLLSSGSSDVSVNWKKVLDSMANRILFPKGVPVR